MLIQTTKITSEPITAELELPAYFRDATYHYAIIDEKNVLSASKYGVNNFGDNYMANAISGVPITEAEFLAMWVTGRAATNIQQEVKVNNPAY